MFFCTLSIYNLCNLYCVYFRLFNFVFCYKINDSDLLYGAPHLTLRKCNNVEMKVMY